GVFHQWKKGFELARGELVWVAESDDYCSVDFLEEMVRCFQTEGVQLAYSDTHFVEGPRAQSGWSLSAHLSDLDPTRWMNAFILSANGLVRHYWSAKNIVPNVSGTVFRHPRGLALL